MSLVKVLIIFIVIFILSTRVKKWICIAIFAGALVGGLIFSLGFTNTIKTIFQGMFTSQSILLSILVSLITIMGSIMKETRLLDDCRKAALALFPSGRSAGAFMASMVGLLPMPGGALFSAPLVESSIKSEKFSNQPGLLVIVNYWFRHIWEFWWPLYPAIIALLAVAEMELSNWIPVSIIFTPISILLGWVFLLRKVKSESRKKNVKLKLTDIKPFIPLLSVIISAVVLKIISNVLKIEVETALLIIPSILTGILMNLIMYRTVKINYRVVFDWRRILPIAILLFSIMGYKEVIIRADISSYIAVDIGNLHLPVIILFAFLPFISGVITGIAVGFIGSSFPLIVTMLNDFPEYSKIAVLVFAFGWGYVGMMLSPFHACFLFSKDYFTSSWKNSYKFLLLPSAVLAVIFTIAYLILSRFSL